jgi:polysaccharide pyruvyl transferase WcaK-like protein
MPKILLHGVIPENNFGGPSLMHGAREIIKEVNNNYEIVFYHSSEPVDISVNDMEFKVYRIPYKGAFELLKDAFKYKFGIRPKREEQYKFFEEIKSSDIVANLYGICFCSNFGKGKYSYIRAIKSAIGQFPISFIAKIFGVKSVKCTASYGPIESKMDMISARFSSKHIFNVMVARETESKMQLEKVTKKNITVSPDLANLMPYTYNSTIKNLKTIGISVSHQIIRQWKSDEKYIDCMVNLIEHINSSTDRKVVLIPNEIIGTYHDIHVAEEIKSLLKSKDDVEILDVANMSSSDLKNHIASYDIMVASRYHSCVAALSAGVPTLIIGWHHKYDELLKWYDQSQWILSSENCSKGKLIALFDKFWSKREENRLIIKGRYPAVRKALINAGKEMFTV